MQYREKSPKVEALQFKTTPDGIAVMKEFVSPYILEVNDNTEIYKQNGVLFKIDAQHRTFRVLGYRLDGSLDRINFIAMLYPDSWIIKNKRNPSSKKILEIEHMDDYLFQNKYENDPVCSV